MTEFQELVKDAPNFVSMKRGELVAYAYAMYAAGVKTDAENVKLRKFAHGLIDGYECGRGELCEGCTWDGMDDPREFNCKVRAEARELGVKADDAG